MNSKDGAADGGDDEREDGGDGEIEEAEDEALEDGEDADADADGAEGDDAEAGGDDEERPQRQARNVARRPSREERAARRENTELRERLDRLERERGPQAPQFDPAAQARADQEFVERLRLMDPVDAALELERRAQQRIGQYVSGVEGRMMDRHDKTSFEAKAERSAARKRLGPEVERHVADLRRQGNFQATRDQVFHLLLGMEVDAKVEREGPRQRAQAQRRVQSQTARPGAARGDVPRSRTPREGTLEGDRALVEEGRRRGVPLW